LQMQSDNTAIVGKVSAGYAAFDAVIAMLSLDDLDVPVLAGGWSVKDVLAHVTFWQLRLLRLLDDEVLPFSLPGEDEQAALNRINAEVYSQNRDRPASEILAAYRVSRDRVLAELRAKPEALLLQHLDPIRWNTWEHCEEHAASIQEWLASR
jgi:uncharacterized protein (TIGR03083 family)